MAQSADQAAVTGIITAQQQKLLVDKSSKEGSKGFQSYDCSVQAEVRCIKERKVGLRNGFGSERGCRVYSKIPAHQELLELTRQLKAVKEDVFGGLFYRSTGEAGKGGDIHQDSGARNRSSLVIGASCGT